MGGYRPSRKSQALIGVGHMPAGMPNGWDGRNSSLEAQAKASIATGSMSMRDTETPVKVEIVEQRNRTVPEYVQRFKTALPTRPLNIDSIATAIAAYQKTFEPGPAPFDRWIEGDESAISDAAKRGFVLFNGKALCSGCHTGWRLTDDKFHDIGTTTTDASSWVAHARGLCRQVVPTAQGTMPQASRIAVLQEARDDRPRVACWDCGPPSGRPAPIGQNTPNSPLGRLANASQQLLAPR
jgi:cytochrome c peroxidase